MDDGEETGTTYFKALTLDIDYYQSILDNADVSEDKKQELIEILWAIVVQFVDMGFGIHPLQQTPSQASLQTDKLERVEHHPAVTKMIAEAVNQNAEHANNQITGKLKEAWPERDDA